ncbi:ASF1 [Candida pseudojiufengensis]|uniref:ASF1 n=1 Tax=Candida pseudojiufengensis TaxID=497109 RepID=UPI0022257496|nr:ASF1 [Candida pseudojiufengensis]KAI5962228.1 ASF1 [Candida pseudojiufengensis]
MSIVSLTGIEVLNNPAKFTDPYEFQITFECLESLKEDLEWKLTYVGSSDSLDHDQELDSILVGPVPIGVNSFLFTADAPSPELIPASELVSVTVIILSCSYNEKEFVRVGYYVNNEYDTEELRENPPTKVQVDHVVRNILAEKPRVTRFNIVWDNENNVDEYPPEQPEDVEEEEEEEEGEEEEEDDDEEGEEEEEDEELGIQEGGSKDVEDDIEDQVEDIGEEDEEEDIIGDEDEEMQEEEEEEAEISTLNDKEPVIESSSNHQEQQVDTPKDS